MKNIVKIILFISLIFCSNQGFSNNLIISNIHLSQKNTIDNYVYICFDIKWDNSWKVNAEPFNWDAAWVFAKYRINGGVWQHVSLSVNENQHIAAASAIIDASDDGKGVFVYRAESGAGSFILTDIKLRWMYGEDLVPDDVSNLEIKVFGIEMVYVPAGSFYIGDGYSDGRFYDATLNQPALIGTNRSIIKCATTTYDDAMLINDGIAIDGDLGIATNDGNTIDNFDFPTGYHSFYCMKDEITCEQYAEFLNTLTRGQQNNRTIRSTAGNAVTLPFPMSPNGQIYARNCVRYSIPSSESTQPAYFYCDMNNNGIGNEEDDGQNIAVGLLGWADGAAYADWAGLRPMTELEFEKACRGPEVPIAREFSWHNTTITGTATLAYIFNDLNKATEYPLNPGTGIYGNAAYQYTTGHVDVNNPNRLDGPVRVGMFATSNSDRVNAGASYYGILDLTGNQSERCVTIGKIEGRAFRGTNGDGYLSVAPAMLGNATNQDWPGILSTAPEDGVKIRIGSGLRGGDWNDPLGSIWVSRRTTAAEDPHWVEHISHGHPAVGFRCVRTAD